MKLHVAYFVFCLFRYICCRLITDFVALMLKNNVGRLDKAFEKQRPLGAVVPRETVGPSATGRGNKSDRDL